MNNFNSKSLREIILNIEAVKTNRTALLKSIEDINTLLNNAATASPFGSVEELQKTINSLSSIIVDTNAMTSLTATAQTDINYTVNCYNTLATEYHTIVAEYKRLHSGVDMYYQVLSLSLIRDFATLYAEDNNIVYDTDVELYLNKREKTSLSIDALLSSIVTYAQDYINYLTMNLSSDVYLNSQASISVDFKDRRVFTSSKLQTDEYAQNCLTTIRRERYIYSIIEDCAKRYDKKHDYFKLLGQAWLGLADTQLSIDAMRIYVTFPLLKIVNPEFHRNISIYFNEKGGAGKSEFLVNAWSKYVMKPIFGSMLSVNEVSNIENPSDWRNFDYNADRTKWRGSLYTVLTDWMFKNDADINSTAKLLNEPHLSYCRKHSNMTEQIKMLSIPFMTTNDRVIHFSTEKERRVLQLKGIITNTEDSEIRSVIELKKQYLDPMLKDGYLMRVFEQACWLALNADADEVMDFDVVENSKAKDSKAAAANYSVLLAFAHYLTELEPRVRDAQTRGVNIAYYSKQYEITHQCMSYEYKFQPTRWKEIYEQFCNDKKGTRYPSYQTLMKMPEFSTLFEEKKIGKDRTRTRVFRKDKLEEFEEKTCEVLEEKEAWNLIEEWKRCIIAIHEWFYDEHCEILTEVKEVDEIETKVENEVETETEVELSSENVAVSNSNSAKFLLPLDFDADMF